MNIKFACYSNFSSNIEFVIVNCCMNRILVIDIVSHRDYRFHLLLYANQRNANEIDNIDNNTIHA